jgi:hypothetical protein
MVRVTSRRLTSAIPYHARFVLVGAFSALLLLGALSPTAAGAAPSAQDQRREPASYVVQREATVTANASNPARSHRLALPGVFLAVSCFAALAAPRVAYRRRRSARRRVEQFHVRLRGPPHLLVAH